MDIEEYERRGIERRRNRNAHPTDRAAIIIGAALAAAVIIGLVWGVMS